MARPVRSKGMNSLRDQLFTSSLFERSPDTEPKKEIQGDLFADHYPLRILIAEDNYINRRVLVLLLQRLGYQAVCVENGLECLNEALKESYDLILTDVDMPEMDGIECTIQLRHAGLIIPIIAVTASFLENARDHCLRMGMDGYLAKPVLPEELKSALRETFHKKSEKYSISF